MVRHKKFKKPAHSISQLERTRLQIMKESVQIYSNSKNINVASGALPDQQQHPKINEIKSQNFHRFNKPNNVDSQ